MGKCCCMSILIISHILMCQNLRFGLTGLRYDGFEVLYPSIRAERIRISGQTHGFNLTQCTVRFQKKMNVSTLILRGGGAKWQRVEDLVAPRLESAKRTVASPKAKVPKAARQKSRKKKNRELPLLDKGLRKLAVDVLRERAAKQPAAAPTRRAAPTAQKPRTPAAQWYAEKAAASNATLLRWAQSDAAGASCGAP